MKAIKSPEDGARAARMARMKMPEYQIAFVLGIGVKALRALYAPEMLTAVIEAELEVLETLYRMAISGNHVGATMLWAKAYGGVETRREKEPKKASSKDYGRVPLGPDDFQVFGPNGERLD